MHSSQDNKTTAEVYHATTYGYLYDQLLAYRHADVFRRQEMLCWAIHTLQTLQSDVQADNNLALKQYTTMVEIATLIRYAKNLRKLEQHEEIDILNDFKGMDLGPDPTKNITIDLREWFAIHPTAPKIRFLKDMKAYSGPGAKDVWASLDAARVRHIEKKGNKSEFAQIMRPISDFTQHDDGLFPGVFTWLGQYHNEAVDRVVYNTDGTILNMVTAFGEYFLSGGGMRSKSDTVVNKVVQETIEEHYSDIFKAHIQIDKSGHIYDANNNIIVTISSENYVNQELEEERSYQPLYDCIAPDLVKTILDELKKTYASLCSDPEITRALQQFQNSTGKVTQRLEALIIAMERLGTKNPILKSELLSFKAQLLTKLFVHSPLYQPAVAYLLNQAKILRIPQLLDMRAGSGSQISSLLLSRPLENFLNAVIYNGQSLQRLGDDVAHANKHVMTLMQALEHCSTMRFSHLLLILEAYRHGTEIGNLQPGQLWQAQDFETTRTAMIEQAKAYLLDPQELLPHAQRAMEAMLMRTNISIANRIIILQRFSAVTQAMEAGAEGCAVIQTFQQDIRKILHSRALLDLLKDLLIVTCAAILVTACGFGLGLIVGVWASPGAFLSIIMHHPYISGAAATLITTSGLALAYKHFMVFANNHKANQEISKIDNTVESTVKLR